MSGASVLFVEDVAKLAEDAAALGFRGLDVRRAAEAFDGCFLGVAQRLRDVDHHVDEQVAIAAAVEARKSLAAQA